MPDLLLALDIDPYAFACDGPVLGIPHGFNVLTNVPFLLVGLWGLLYLHRRGLLADARFVNWTGLWTSVALVAFGSGAYHFFLTPATLALDRACIVGIMAFVAAEALVVALDRSPSCRLSLLLLVVLEGSVAAWLLGATAWIYGGLQAVGGVAVLLLLIRAARRGRVGRETLRPVVLFVALYALAKVVEVLDEPVCRLTGVIGGHPMKHLLAALALLCLGGWMAATKRAAAPPGSPGES